MILLSIHAVSCEQFPNRNHEVFVEDSRHSSQILNSPSRNKLEITWAMANRTPKAAAKGSHHIRCPSWRYPNTPETKNVFETRRSLVECWMSEDLISWIYLDYGEIKISYCDLPFGWLHCNRWYDRDYHLTNRMSHRITEVDTQTPDCPSAVWKEETNGVLMERLQSNRYTTAVTIETGPQSEEILELQTLQMLLRGFPRQWA